MKYKNFIILILIMILNIILHADEKNINTKFLLNAQIFDYGQNIVSVELLTSDLKNIDMKSIDVNTFKVHAKGTLPVIKRENEKSEDIFKLSDTTKALGLFDVYRIIEKVTVNKKGNIVLHLRHGLNIEGANTLAYITGEVSRNVMLNLIYTVTQEKEFKLKDGTVISKVSVYKQGEIIDKEGDKFISEKSEKEMNYQLFKPLNRKGKRPLIVWFHGNGEGGYGEYRNNVSQKLANRGAVAFADNRTQKIFGGAYVIAPQVDDTWYNNYKKDYIEKVKSLIDEIIGKYNIDAERIYAFGASAGGYMAIRMAVEYPELFAGVNVSAPAINLAPERGGVKTVIEEIRKIKNIPFWFVHAENDTTVNYETSSKWLYENLKKINSETFISVYHDVKINGTEYDGHWSWIYSLRNIPQNSRKEYLFEWMSKQSRR